MMKNSPEFQVRRDIYRRILLSVFIGVVATALGLSFGYPTTLTPEKDYRTFSGIARDGWIENGATISLPRLFSRGNRMALDIGKWRPAGQPPAELSFLLCGKEIARHIIVEDKTVELFLTGDCQPRVVEMRVLNPFIASPTDQRELGAQLRKVELSSRLGPPLITPDYIFAVAPFVLVLMLLTIGLVPISYSLPSVLAVATCAGWLIATTHIAPTAKLFYPWIVVVTSLFGMHVAKGYRGKEEEVAENCSATSLLALAIILGVGGYLRFVNLDFGLPMNYHPDEVPKVNAIMRMYATGTLNPQYFLHPTLLLYSAYGMNTLLHGMSIFDGEFQSTLVLAGRLVSASAGFLSIFLVYKIGKLLFSIREGLFAAALLAVFPLHVTCSRYLKEDSLLTFFVLLSFLFTALAYKQKKPGWLILSGLFAGCASSVKYSGLLAAGIPCLGAMCVERRWIPKSASTYRYLAAALILVPIAFVVCSPYVVLDSPKFIKDFTVEQNHMSKGHYFAITPWSQYWTYHIERSLFNGITSPPFFLTFLAIGFIAWRQYLPGLMILSLIFAFYFPAEYVKAKPAPQPERYILPCLPFIALAISSFFSRIVPGRLTFLFLSVIVLLSPALRSFQLHSELVPDTRLQMARWMEENLPQRAKVYIDHKRYSPELSEERFEITYAPRAAIHKDLDLELLTGEGQEYLLLSSLWYDRYFSQPRTDEAVKKKIEYILEHG
ncbi:MAG: glycosyltransferase family 39 protein, partial [Bdellovibrionales bacterium]|nr:glycosyltransferase family 39 protein [Bdellovibrionales bacterium]